MRTLFALIAVGLDAAATRFKSKIEKTAAAVVVGVVGVGLLVGSLSLFADPVSLPDDPPGTGFPGASMNVCAPVISSITVTDDGSAGFRVSVDFSHGWDMFRWIRWSPISWRGSGYDFGAKDAVLHNPLERGDFWNSRIAWFDTVLRTADGQGRDVHLIILLVAVLAANTLRWRLNLNMTGWLLLQARNMTLMIIG